MGELAREKLASAHGAAHVLSIGVSEYGPHSGFTKLRVCTEDARRVAQAFRDVRELNADPSQIRLLAASPNAAERPTGGQIYSAVKMLAESATEDNRVLVFFSGHGVRIENEFYLVPEDGNSQITKTMIAFRELLELLDGSDAKHKIVVLDACLSGPTATNFKSPLSEASPKFLTEYIEQTKGTAILASSTADQPSTILSPDPKVSLFTHFFVNALQGKPEALDGKLLTLDSLFTFVSTSVVKSSKSYGKTQQPTLKATATGVIVIGDFSRPLLSAAASDLVPAVDHLSFHDSRRGEATDVLSALKYTWKHDAEYIESRVNDVIPEAMKNNFGAIRAKLFGVFGIKQVQLRDNGVDFPGGSYTVTYSANDVKHGIYTHTVRFDSDWLTRTNEMLSLLKLIGVTNPDVIEFTVSHELNPGDCLPKLQAAGWTITNAQDDEVRASLGGFELTIKSGSLELSGFTPPELFGDDKERDDSALLVTGLIKQLAVKTNG